MINYLHFGPRQVGVTAAAALALAMTVAVPSAGAATAPQAAVVDGTLSIVGTSAADTVTLALAADPTQLVVDFGQGNTHTFARATFTGISAALGNGDDTFTVNNATGVVPIPMLVVGGNGNDTITGGAADDTLVGGNGNDVLRGGDGNDVIFGNNGDDSVDGQKGADTQVLGSGDDVAIWLPGEGSDTTFGGSGADTLRFDGAGTGAGANEKFALTADGTHAIFTRDVGNIRMDNQNVETLDLAALGGTDTVTVGDLSATDLVQANVDLGSSRGGAADGVLDVVTVNGTSNADHLSVTAGGSAVDVTGLQPSVHVTGADTRDQLQVNTADGNDSVAVTDAARALITVGVDLGGGQL